MLSAAIFRPCIGRLVITAEKRVRVHNVRNECDVAKRCLTFAASCNTQGFRHVRQTDDKILTRNYAKKSSKSKAQKWKGATHVSVGEGVIDFAKLEDQMRTSESKFQEYVAKQDASRISAGMLDNIKVTSDDGVVPLYHIAEVVMKKDHFVVNVMIDEPADIIKTVSEAISAAGMGLVPVHEGATLRIPLPKWIC